MACSNAPSAAVAWNRLAPFAVMVAAMKARTSSIVLKIASRKASAEMVTVAVPKTSSIAQTIVQQHLNAGMAAAMAVKALKAVQPIVTKVDRSVGMATAGLTKPP